MVYVYIYTMWASSSSWFHKPLSISVPLWNPNLQQVNLTEACLVAMAILRVVLTRPGRRGSVVWVSRSDGKESSMLVGSDKSTWICDLPSGKHTKNYGKSPFGIGKSTINGPFSIAMLNYQRVYFIVEVVYNLRCQRSGLNTGYAKMIWILGLSENCARQKNGTWVNQPWLCKFFSFFRYTIG